MTLACAEDTTRLPHWPRVIRGICAETGHVDEHGDLQRAARPRRALDTLDDRVARCVPEAALRLHLAQPPAGQAMIRRALGNRIPQRSVVRNLGRVLLLVTVEYMVLVLFFCRARLAPRLSSTCCALHTHCRLPLLLVLVDAWRRPRVRRVASTVKQSARRVLDVSLGRRVWSVTRLLFVAYPLCVRTVLLLAETVQTLILNIAQQTATPLDSSRFFDGGGRVFEQ